MRRILSLLIVLSAVLLAGCATQSRSDTLTTTLTAYSSTLRWGDFQSAVQFIDPKIRADHPLSKLDMERYQQVKVSGYDEGAGPVPAGEGQVKQTVHISLVNIHTQTERTIIDHQTWHYDEKSKHWWLISGLPDITQD
ncbi:hypothetical protein B0E46_11295 [Rhodanobacter sp. B04]|uniref:hypothetical protein n=1 Tax=Rhodanobacter sp. B04 TaxID=1945860 RepID=UPI000985E11D|nr:hypothetical protein [Rhodanobacter sp. B04]OOG62808.1 hypothetical protein B0E46_11295 [Rhodanobacter sp. B04]